MIKKYEAVSNRTAAIMYGLSALIWIGCMGLNIKAIMAELRIRRIYIYNYSDTASMSRNTYRRLISAIQKKRFMIY